MPYKDKVKQRAAQRERTRRYRARHKGVTSQSVTSEGVTPVMTPEGPKPEVPANYGQPDCQCRHCQQTKVSRERGQLIINHGPRKSATELGDNEANRVSLPGDVDYEGVAVATRMAQDGRAQDNEVQNACQA